MTVAQHDTSALLDGCRALANDPTLQGVQTTPEGWAAHFASQSGAFRLYQDGDRWCAMVGINLQDGVCGFGASPAAALRAFLHERARFALYGSGIPARVGDRVMGLVRDLPFPVTGVVLEVLPPTAATGAEDLCVAIAEPVAVQRSFWERLAAGTPMGDQDIQELVGARMVDGDTMITAVASYCVRREHDAVIVSVSSRWGQASGFHRLDLYNSNHADFLNSLPTAPYNSQGAADLRLTPEAPNGVPEESRR